MTRLDHIVPVTLTGVRVTIPALEALASTGNPVVGVGVVERLRYDVTLVRPPEGLVLVLLGAGNEQHRGLRLADEPPYPGEWRQANAISWWERGELTPCPTCGYALVWCEAGFVPGWRICLAGHASLLSADGRSAARKPSQDRATLRATKGPLG